MGDKLHQDSGAEIDSASRKKPEVETASYVLNPALKPYYVVGVRVGDVEITHRQAGLLDTHSGEAVDSTTGLPYFVKADAVADKES